MPNEIIAAIISFVAALGAVVIGQRLTERSQRLTDERRWAREDAARRRLRGEELAREARKALLEAAAMFEASWLNARRQSRHWESPDDEALRGLTDRAEDLAIEIADDEIRIFVRTAATVLNLADDANQGGAPPPWQIALSVAAETDAVMGAYLRGERIPRATEVNAAALAAGEWRAEKFALEAKYREQERQERAEARKASPQQPG